MQRHRRPSFPPSLLSSLPPSLLFLLSLAFNQPPTGQEAESAKAQRKGEGIASPPLLVLHGKVPAGGEGGRAGGRGGETRGGGGQPGGKPVGDFIGSDKFTEARGLREGGKGRREGGEGECMRQREGKERDRYVKTPQIFLSLPPVPSLRPLPFPLTHPHVPL